MKEKIFNIFLFIEEGIITNVGIRAHLKSGTDTSKLEFLQGRVDHDCKQAERRSLPNWVKLVQGKYLEDGKLSYEGFNNLDQHERMQILDAIFSELQEVKNPLMAITCILNGKPRIEGVVDLAGKPL